MSRRARFMGACVLVALAWPGLCAAADAGWHYTIGTTLAHQQANFCENRQAAEEIAGIFQRFGPRAGYAALAGAPDCSIAERSFTPRKLLTTITVSEGEQGEYQLRFVEVEDQQGETLYLVTTRAVVAR